MLIPKIKGLKYPDEYFIKFFFKERLHEKTNLKFLEFDCGNGNNLMLPYQYNHEVIGIDYDKTLISYANENFRLLNFKNKYSFYAEDMKSFAKNTHNIMADVFLLPSVIYYISREDFILFLENIVKNNNIKKETQFYIRVRSKKDFRFGYGEKIAENRYKLPLNSITNESNANIEFYSEYEILEILKEVLKLRQYKLFNLDCQNEHNGIIILNSDIVIWGIVN